MFNLFFFVNIFTSFKLWYSIFWYNFFLGQKQVQSLIIILADVLLSSPLSITVISSENQINAYVNFQKNINFTLMYFMTKFLIITMITYIHFSFQNIILLITIILSQKFFSLKSFLWLKNVFFTIKSFLNAEKPFPMSKTYFHLQNHF